jgi:hypothetical protein
MKKKGNEFKGWAGGRNYRNFARLFGFTTAFYRKGVGNVTLATGMTVTFTLKTAQWMSSPILTNILI